MKQKNVVPFKGLMKLVLSKRGASVISPLGGIVFVAFMIFFASLSHPKIEGSEIGFPLRQMNSNTDLTGITLIASKEFGTHAHAEKIQNALKERFGIFATVEDLDGLSPDVWNEPERWRRPMILLGDLKSNRAMARLYGMRLTYIDGFFPGKSGWVIQTLVDPLGYGGNVIILGSSGEEGLSAAVEEFIKRLGSINEPVFPWTIESVIRSDASKALPYGIKLSSGTRSQIISQGKGILNNLTPDGVNNFFFLVAQMGEGYLLTGDNEYALAYKELARAISDYMDENPERATSLISDSRNMWSWGPRVFSAWHAIEPSPIFSEEDRLRITVMLYKLAQINRRDGYLVRMFTPSVRWNHEIYPGLSLFYAANYFARYYPTEETLGWMELAQACFERNTSYLGLDEGSDYIFHVPEKSLDYAVSTGRDTLIREGLKSAADLFVIFIDNLGVMGGGGDTYPLGYSSAFSWGHSKLLWMASWYFEDPLYVGMLEKVRQSPIPQNQPDWDNPLHSYITDVSGGIPEKYPPVTWVPLDEAVYNEVQSPSSTAYYGKKSSVPLEKTFHKLALREGFELYDQYLLLDGFSAGRHGHETGNSILNLNDGGRIWLADKDYIQIYPDRSNGLVVVKDGVADKKEPFTSLEATATFSGFSFVRTLQPQYNGVDWFRNILWKRGSFFLVIDEVEVKEEGTYLFENLWHGLGKAELIDGHDFKLTQDGDAEFHIISFDNSEKRLRERDKHTRKYWDAYPYTDAPITVLREIWAGEYKEGEGASYINLLIGKDHEFASTKVGERSLLLIIDGEKLLMGTSGLESPSLDLKTDADIFVIGEKEVHLIGVKEFRWSGISFDLFSDFKVNVYLSLEDKMVRLEGRGAQVTLGDKTFLITGEMNIDLDSVTSSNLLDEKQGWPWNAFSCGYREGSSALSIDWLEKGISLLKMKKIGEVDGIVSAFASGDLDGNGEEDLVIGTRSGSIIAMSQDGKALWQYGGERKGILSSLSQFVMGGMNNPGWINEIYIDDLKGNGELTILATSEDWNLYALNKMGKLLWKKAFPNSREYAELKGSLIGTTAITTARLPGEKEKTIYVGTQFRYLYSLTSKGEERWKEALYYYGINDLASGDLCGDGYDEVAVALEYYYLATIKNTKSYREPGMKGPGWSKVEIIDFDGDGRGEVVAGTAGGWLYGYKSNGLGGYVKWRQNIGGEVTSILGADITGDGIPEILAGGNGFYVYAIDGSGRVLWRLIAPDAITTIDVIGDGASARIYVGLENGGVMICTANGNVIAYGDVGSAVCGLKASKNGQNAFKAIIVTERGGVFTLE